MIGQSLEEIRKDLRLMPTPALMQYKQNPGKQAIDGVPLDMLAGLELSRRAELQQAQIARMAPNAGMPSVIDQQAMGLMGAPQAPAVNPAMPGQPPQFAAQPAPQPPQAPPQQMAQAPAPEQPQGMQMPMQPTQQQPKKLAVGGLASLGDMQDARDQGMPPPGAYPPGQPVMRMAGGGIVAFADNKDQPVDADMPADNRSQFRKDIGSFIESLQEKPEDEKWRRFVQERQQAGAPIQYFLSSSDEYKQNKEVSNFIKDNPEAFKDPANRAAFMQDPRGFMSTYQKPGAPKPVPVPGEAPAKADETKITQVPDTGVDALIKQFGGGFKLPPRSAEQTAAINEANAVLTAAKALQSPEVPEADRERIIEEQFRKNQATTKPFYDRMTRLLEEERAATKERFASKDADAMIRAGLHGLSARKPGMTGFFEGVTQGLDYHDRISELESTAMIKNRQAEMDLMKAQMADEKGDRKAAQDYFDSYQRNKREAYAAQVSSLNLRVQAAKVPADIANQEERLGMQMQNLNLRQQLGLANLAARQQGAGQPTISEVTQINKAREAAFAPGSPTALKYFGKLPGGDRVVADIKAGRLKPGMPQYDKALEDAQRIWYRETYGGARRGGTGVSSYDQAASDLGVQ